jgi:NADH-quinone oxidoreductase subunit N
MNELGNIGMILPQAIVAATAVVVMGAIAVRRSPGIALSLSLAGLAAAFVALVASAASGGAGGAAAVARVTPLFVVDGYARIFAGLILLTALAVLLLSAGYLRRAGEPAEEYCLLLLLATLGAIVLVASRHFASLFLGLEILSVSLYALIAYPRRRSDAAEAAVKYLILAGFSSAFLLFGMALLYARLGTLEFGELATRLRALPGAMGAATPLARPIADPLVLAGLALMLAGIGFKLAVVPFHMWTPDVYQGAPAPVTAFVASASKGAVLAVLLRFAGALGLMHTPAFAWLIALIAIASMFAGNLLALRQASLKRLLAYSSIAHLGYLLIALLAGGAAGMEAVIFYLVAYTATTLGAFGVITVVSGPAGDLDALDGYAGLGSRRPWLAGTLAAMLLSLGGIPLTAGFIGKFLVIRAGVGAAQWALVILLAVNSAISIYYYLRVVVAMYLRESDAQGAPGTPGAPPAVRVPVPAIAKLTLALLVIALFWLGVWPGPLLRIIARATGGL